MLGFEVYMHMRIDVCGINLYQVALPFPLCHYQLVNLSPKEQRFFFLSTLDICSQNAPINSTHYSRHLSPMPALHDLHFNQKAAVSSKSVASWKLLIYGDDPSPLPTSQVHRVRGALEIFIQTDKIFPI